MSGLYTRQVAFLVDRLRPDAVLGLLLTTQLAVLITLGAAFGTVVDSVTENEDLVTLDRPVGSFLIEAREPGLTRFFEIITWAGSGTILFPLVLIVGFALHRITGSWGPLTVLGVSLAGATTLSTLIKLVVARPRPPVLALVDAIGYAFPSGHTTAATAGWLSLALVLGTFTPRWGPKMVLVTTALIIAGFVGLSRIYLGVHELTDVLGGWSLGALWVAAVIVAVTVRSAGNRTARE